MSEYAVVISEPAERDLLGIYTYIADTLKEPQTARRVYVSIKQELLGLSKMPERHKVIDGSPYSELGIRKLFVENYVAFYTTDKKQETVSVLRILYNRREWQSILFKGSDPNTDS
ncbi:MAG: type II toxin-antitoxin system RelE/ParE family toxin [Clostridiales bacterium]|nr:type II toxin-antitoxin system RelE/ParE family toxin [Clostridiales bacterium]